MKFSYEYRTSDNARHTGAIDAPNREAAFQSLKARGIRPGRLVEAPGFLNKLFGKGKRWLTIVMLGVLCLLLGILFYSNNSKLSTLNSQLLFEDRAQLFGDPSVIQKLSRNGWRETFPDEGESWLARHAIPGKACGCATEGMWRPEIADALAARKDKPLAIADGDSDELKKMKRMVNGMKREFADYVEVPSDALDYIGKACERCRVEKGVRDSIARELAALERQLEKPDADRDKILAAWDKKNAALRAMGLSTIPQPE